MCRRRENLRMFFSFEKYFFYTTLTLLSEVVSTAVPKLRVYERFSICWREIWKQSMSFFINNYSIQKKKQRRRRNFYNFWQKTSFYKEKCADRRENLKNLDSTEFLVLFFKVQENMAIYGIPRIYGKHRVCEIRLAPPENFIEIHVRLKLEIWNLARIIHNN
jgi:hypothetical protein